MKMSRNEWNEATIRNGRQERREYPGPDDTLFTDTMDCDDELGVIPSDDECDEDVYDHDDERQKQIVDFQSTVHRKMQMLFSKYSWTNISYFLGVMSVCIIDNREICIISESQHTECAPNLIPKCQNTLEPKTGACREENKNKNVHDSLRQCPYNSREKTPHTIYPSVSLTATTSPMSANQLAPYSYTGSEFEVEYHTTYSPVLLRRLSEPMTAARECGCGLRL